jgi:hypothetical protein
MRNDRAQVDQLRKSLDPLYRSSMQYATALDQINDNLARNLITQQQADRLNDLAARKYLTMADGMDQITHASRGNANGLRNVSLQLSQVAQQGAVTGDYLGAIGIQLPDMLIGFGLWGAAIGAVSAVLAPMIVDMMKTESAMKRLEGGSEALADAMSGLQSSISSANQPVVDLIRDYRAFADRAAELLAVQREIANLDAISALTETAQAISGVFGSLQDLSGGREEVQRGWDSFASTTRRLSRDFDISIEQAAALAEALRDVAQAEGPADQAEALRRAREQIELAAGGLGEMDDETRAVYASMLKSELAASRLAAIDMASGVGAAADEAGRLAANLLTAANVRFQAQSKVYSGRGGDPRQFEEGGTGASASYSRELNYQSVSAIIADLNRKGSHGRSGGMSDAQREANELMREAERITEATRTAQEEYNDAIERADLLRSKQLITEETYLRHVQDLREELSKTEGFDIAERAIDGVSEAIARSAVYGNNLRDSLNKVWKGIAFDLMNSGIRDALQIVFDGVSGGSGRQSGGFFGSLLKSVFSFDGGGYTGDGPRVGGVDGKGGFWGVLHPQETVIDHTRGQSMQSGVTEVRVVGGDLTLSDDGTIMAQFRVMASEGQARTVDAIAKRMRNQPKAITGLA